jgi:uncharacterized coiled-coil DUF342 family protein
MDILKSLSKIFKLEIILLLLLVVLFTLFNKQCMKKIMENLENNEQCKPEEACKKLSELQTKMNDLNTENNKATEKIDQLKKEANNTNSVNTQINANTAKIAMLQTQLNTMKESHSKTAKAANEAHKTSKKNTKVIGDAQNNIKHMATIK